MPKTKELSVDQEFVVGNLFIGWVDSDLKDHFGGQTFPAKKLGSFQKLGHYFSNADEIEKELNPGKCELGDVYAFLKNPPEGTKDGRYNLFLVGDRVLSVRWGSGNGAWDVGCWSREGGWGGDNRVFSPETDSRSLSPKPSDTFAPKSEVKELETVVTKIEYRGRVYELSKDTSK